MLLALDVGNTNIKVALFEAGGLKSSWRMSSSMDRTADEYGVQMESFFSHLRIPTRSIDGIILSCVIPSMKFTMEHMCAIYFPGNKIMFVDSTLKLGFTSCYDHPEALGSDRICNAVAAYSLYGGPCITIDFGTATNFVVMSRDARFLGGLICPGFQVSVDALIEHTAMLPKVEYNKPPRVICTNTEQAIQSGIIYGYVGQIEYLVKKLKSELGGEECVVVATGGMSHLIASETSAINVLNPILTLQGLSLIYDMNKI